MPCAWNVPAKIVCTIAGLLALGGIITAIMGYVTGNDAVAPDFEAEEVKQWSVSIASEAQQCAWQIYFKEGEDCQAAVDGLTVSGPATWPQSKYTKHCDSNYLLGFDHIEMDGFNLKWFAQVDPNTQATFRKHNTTSYTLTVLSGDSCDFGVYVRSSRSCSAAFSDLTVSGPMDWGNGFESKCNDSFHSQPENYESCARSARRTPRRDDEGWTRSRRARDEAADEGRRSDEARDGKRRTMAPCERRSRAWRRKG